MIECHGEIMVPAALDPEWIGTDDLMGEISLAARHTI